MNLLIVEDDAAVGKLFCRQLEQNGYRCDHAPSADAARQKLMDRSYDLILCDIMMPGENGIDLIRAINTLYPNLAAIMMTGNDDPDLAEQALKLNIYGMLLKPVSMPQLVIAVHNALRRARLEHAIQDQRAYLEHHVAERTAELQATLTDLQQAEQALSNSRASFQAIVERSTEAIFVTDENGAIQFANPAAGAIFGKDRHALIEQPFGLALVAGEATEIDILRPDKQVGCGELRVSPTAWEGRPAYLLTVRDITERVQMEAALQTTADELKATVQSLEQANQRIVEQQKSIIEQERLNVLMQIAGATARELDHPLTELLENIESLARRREDAARVQIDMERVGKSGAQVAAIIKQMLTLRGISEGSGLMTGRQEGLDRDINMLVVGDLNGDYEKIKGHLAECPGIHVQGQFEYQQALCAIELHDYDLIFVANNLPNGSISDFMRKLNQQGVESPVVVLIGRKEEMIASKMIQLGACDFIPRHLVSRKSLARAISNALEKAQLKNDVRRVMQKMAERSTRDALTGLYNRRYFLEALETEMARAQRYGSDLTLCMIDIDHFKRVNDTYGHLAGDQALKDLAGLFKNKLRQADIACRYGGEEFVVILPNTDRSSAMEWSERFRCQVEGHCTRHGQAEFQFTLSLGLADFIPKTSAVAPKALIERADQALYQAKQTGRNRVVVHREDMNASASAPL